MAVEFETPVGRIVWGSATKSRGKTRKNPATNQQEPVMKDDVQVQVVSFGLAIPKAEFQARVWPYLGQEAQTLYQGGQVPPKFAWKYIDGDGVDDQGKPYSAREGYAGNYVLAISTELQAPPIFKFENGQYRQLDANSLKCGDYVTVGLNVKGNVPADRSQTPGLYVNPLAINFVGYGTEISSVGSVDPNALFKGQQHQLPPGASATPIGGNTGVGMPGMGAGQPSGMPMGGQPMGGQPMMQPGAAPMMAPGQPAAQPFGQPGMAPSPMQQQPMMQQPGMAPAGGYPAQPGMMQPGQPMMAPAGAMPAPAPDFVANAGMPAGQPGMMQPGQPMMAPGGQPMGMPGAAPMMQPGMMPPR